MDAGLVSGGGRFRSSPGHVVGGMFPLGLFLSHVTWDDLGWPPLGMGLVFVPNYCLRWDACSGRRVHRFDMDVDICHCLYCLYL